MVRLPSEFCWQSYAKLWTSERCGHVPYCACIGWVLESNRIKVRCSNPMYAMAQQSMRTALKRMGITPPPVEEEPPAPEPASTAASSTGSGEVTVGANVILGAGVVIGGRQQASDEEASQEWSIANWLEGIKLGEYTQKFVEEGFDDIEVVHEMTNDELVDLGITKAGHRKKILIHARRLNV